MSAWGRPTSVLPISAELIFRVRLSATQTHGTLTLVKPIFRRQACPQLT